MAKPRPDRDDGLLRHFAQNVHRARREAGLSQEALANASGVAQSVISRIEAGAQEPGVRTVVYLARGLRLDVAELMAGLR